MKSKIKKRERKSGRKPTFSDRNCRGLMQIIRKDQKHASPKFTTELNEDLEDTACTKPFTGSYTKSDFS